MWIFESRKADLHKVGKNSILFGLLVGIPNYFSARFLLLALNEKRKLIYVRLNKKTLGEINNQYDWVMEQCCEATKKAKTRFKGGFVTSELNGLIIMHMEYRD